MIKPIRVLLFEVGAPPRGVVIEGDDVDGMQAVVGGYIEAYRLGGRVFLFCNEDGISLGLPPNRLHPGLGLILGTFFLSSSDDSGESVSLTDDEEVQWATISKSWKLVAETP